MGFKEMKMMKSTEPSVDEVGKGMKKGGKTKMMMGGMPKMQMGGMPPMAAKAPMKRPMPARPAMKRPMGRPDPRAAMAEAAMAQAAMPMMRKKGGEVESKKMHSKEDRDIKGVKKDLMMHASKSASKAHKGLKTGGVANYATGGVIQKFATGGVINGYKDGGHCGMKNGGEAGFAKMKKGSC